MVTNVSVVVLKYFVHLVTKVTNVHMVTFVTMVIRFTIVYWLLWGVLPSVVCLSVIVKPRIWGGLGPLGSVEPLEKKKKNLWWNSIVQRAFKKLASCHCMKLQWIALPLSYKTNWLTDSLTDKLTYWLTVLDLRFSRQCMWRLLSFLDLTP
jgi:hypothetical protein